MKRSTVVLCLLGIASTLSGCGSMSGFDAKTSFTCKAPDGILCESMSGVYANLQANNLPGQRVNQHEMETAADLSRAKASGVMTKPIYSGTPIRSAPRTLRLWFAPWEDTDGDLHDQSYVYLPVDSGRWLIEHNRRRIQDGYRPIRAPDNAVAPSASAGQQRPGAQSQPRTVQGNSDEEVIGVRQDRMGSAQAAEMLSGILKPGNLMPGGGE